MHFQHLETTVCKRALHIVQIQSELEQQAPDGVSTLLCEINGAALTTKNTAVLTRTSLFQLLCCLLLGIVVGEQSVQGEVDFVQEIQPIFKERCYDCHSGETREAGLRLDHKGEALAGSDSGVIITPGKPEESLLVKLVAGEDPCKLMPPDGDNLSAKQIDLIKTWIKEGAIWPDGIDPPATRPTHWAYQPLSFTLPELSGQTTPKPAHPIDRFVLAKLQDLQITPSPQADRYTLVKRLYYDLLGLSPPLDVVERFAQDDRPDAYERLVDELLASPHFGERWGRHWLDMARYADSDGYEKDRPRYNAWKYRDWVIDAINRDMPLDQFTIEQIAGDLLDTPTQDQLLATAFHRQTLTNTEGGTDQEEFRVAAVFDRVETIGTVWLGLTVGCARCHSHKYDQISQREYYQLFAFFNNGDEVNANIPTSGAAWENYQQAFQAHQVQKRELEMPLQARKAELQPGFADWLQQTEQLVRQAAAMTAQPQLVSMTSTGGAEFQLLDDGSFLTVKQGTVQDVYELRYDITPVAEQIEGLAGIRLEALTDASLARQGPGNSSGGNFVLSELTVDRLPAVADETPPRRIPFGSATATFSQKGFEVAQAIDGVEDAKGWAISPEVGKAHTATFLFKEPLLLTAEALSTDASRSLLVRMSQQYASNIHTLGRFRVRFLSTQETQLESIPADLRQALLAPEAERSKDQVQKLQLHFFAQDAEYRKLQAAVEAHDKQQPFKPEMTVGIVRQRTSNPRTTHVLKRGDFLQPLSPIGTGTLAVLPDLPQAASDGTEPTRLDFAMWLVSGENPLPPRVLANHIWTRLFGRGLVATANDFGIRGEAPTHPELLDWLASALIDSGWSRKQLIRTILLSETYQRDSIHRPELQEIDPTNRWLSRQNRFRVEAEIVRDLYLTASGLLEPRIGGPSVFPPLPEGFDSLSYANNFKWGASDWNTRPDRPHTVPPKDDIYRRGMYTFFKRTAAHPNLITFDCPDSNTTNVQRETSNTPLQALQTLNNVSFFKAARALAELAINQTNLTDDATRLNWLLRRCISRPPTTAEESILAALLQDARSYYEQHPTAAHELAGVETQSDAIERAAWITVARTVLNLDEFIVRD